MGHNDVLPAGHAASQHGLVSFSSELETLAYSQFQTIQLKDSSNRPLPQ